MAPYPLPLFTLNLGEHRSHAILLYTITSILHRNNNNNKNNNNNNNNNDDDDDDGDNNNDDNDNINKNNNDNNNNNNNNNKDNDNLCFKRVTQSNDTLIFPVALSIQHHYGTLALGIQGYKISLHTVHLSFLFLENEESFAFSSLRLVNSRIYTLNSKRILK